MPLFYLWDFGSLLSLLWIVFQIHCLFSLHLFGLVGFLTCSFDCKIYLWLLVLFNLLCLRSPFYRLQIIVPQSSSIFPQLGEVGSVAYVGLMVGGSVVWTMVVRVGSCHDCQDCVWWCFGVIVSLVPLMAACFLMDDFVYLSCLLFGMRLPSLVFVYIWVELGFRVEMVTSWRALAN